MKTKLNESLWIATTPHTNYDALKGKIEVDVAIVGAGITGITAAYLLKQAGKTVALIEKERVASAESGNTTAHLTEVIDARYHRLIFDFGRAGAKIAAESSRAAMDLIAQLVKKFNIDCGYNCVPAYLYTESWSKVHDLKKEISAAKQLGINASFVKDVPLPFKTKGAAKFENQGEFHPREYLLALIEKIPGDGSHIFEKSQVIKMKEGEPCRLTTENGSVVAKDVIFATNTPIQNTFTLVTKIPAYRTYALGIRLHTPRPLEGLFWDTAEPYHYIRSQTVPGYATTSAQDYLIVGGEDHKTGAEVDTEERYEKLASYSNERFKVESIPYQWSGQIIEPVDGLPYIGLNPGSKHFYLATGFSGNGMTFGTLSAMMLSDLITKNLTSRSQAWSELYSPARIKPLASAKTYLWENKDYPLHMLKDWLSKTPIASDTFSEVKPGDGQVLLCEGKKIAVYHDESGSVQTHSAVCPHMGCIVRFNKAEKTWDCPCHGSRFATDGNLLNGPALKGLEPFVLESQAKQKPKKKKSAA